MRFVELRTDSDNPILLDLHSVVRAEIVGAKGATVDNRAVRVALQSGNYTVLDLKDWARLREWLLDVGDRR